MHAKSDSPDLTLTRLYDAPVKLVWEAYTELKHQENWWGPRGFTITTKSKDLRPGGKWIYTMHDPDGTDYPNIATYHVVEKYSKLVYDHGATETTPPLFQVTVTFKDEKGKCRMDMSMRFASPEVAKQMAGFIKQAGGNSTWDRLGEYLAEKEGHNIFVINRAFEAPISKVYEMFQNPEHLKKWLPPTGLTMEFVSTDVRVGGKSFFFMTDGKMKFFNEIEYLEISPVTNFTYTQTFMDENRNVTRHPFLKVFPAVLKNTIVLTEEGPDDTRITVTTEAYGPTTKEEMEKLIEFRGSMTQGWTGSFDKLEDLLK